MKKDIPSGHDHTKEKKRKEPDEYLFSKDDVDDIDGMYSSEHLENWIREKGLLSEKSLLERIYKVKAELAQKTREKYELLQKKKEEMQQQLDNLMWDARAKEIHPSLKVQDAKKLLELKAQQERIKNEIEEKLTALDVEYKKLRGFMGFGGFFKRDELEKIEYQKRVLKKRSESIEGHLKKDKQEYVHAATLVEQFEHQRASNEPSIPQQVADKKKVQELVKKLDEMKAQIIVLFNELVGHALFFNPEIEARLVHGQVPFEDVEAEIKSAEFTFLKEKET